MRAVVSVCLALALGFVCERSTAHAQSPGAQSVAAVWVAHQGVASVRVGRGVVEAQVERAGPVLLPVERDRRFTLKGTSIRHLPHKNLIELTSEAEVHVAFVSDKTVTVTVQLRPDIHDDSLRLVVVSRSSHISGCAMEGPICFMLKRAVDRHIGDGKSLQAFLDDGLNAALRPVFRSVAEAGCAERQVAPQRVNTAPEFLDVLMAKSTTDLNCLREAVTYAADARRVDFKRADKAHKARTFRNVY